MITPTFCVPQWVYDIMLDKAKLQYETNSLEISKIEAIHDVDIIVEALPSGEGLVIYQDASAVYPIGAIDFLKNYQREDFIEYLLTF